MSTSDARASADYLLQLVIKHQPSFLTNLTGVHIGDGAALAKFFEDFVQAHTEALLKREKAGS